MSDMKLANRLKSIRESLGLKITEAAEKLGFSHYQTLSNIEDAKREVKASELLIFSRVYYCSIEKLLGHEEVETNEIFVWRSAPEERKGEIEKEILYQCEQYQLLENLLNIKSREGFIEVTLDNISTNYNVQNLASSISKLLELGRRPAFTLQKVLEQDYGIKILFYQFGDGSSLSTVSPRLGNIIVINNNEAPWRQNFDLAHELFHLLTWKVVVQTQSYEHDEYNEDIEKKADLFASVLLLPANELKKEVLERLNDKSEISDSDLIDIAIEFGVSTQALIYRLSNLNFITFETATKVVRRVELLETNKLRRAKEWQSRESEQFINIAIRCLRKGLISRSKFAELIGIQDRNDIDNFITKRGSIEKEGTNIEIMAS
ncbi:helix-turn-helix domain protein [bacterium BMS3Abin10]|nr:helix-turn-helix domain protein [bacterium BMS3Abin10]GBE38791.1 helix-turn-helix domain protein [bacterium BMS3Bbin08]HDH49973.1 ImmA/IrrE family metallo-endopeptidase [Nitrospirota bacterium]